MSIESDLATVAEAVRLRIPELVAAIREHLPGSAVVDGEVWIELSGDEVTGSLFDRGVK